LGGHPGTNDERTSLETGAPSRGLEPRAPGSRSSPPAASASLAEDRLAALMALVSDESPTVWARVREELASGGKRSRSALVRAAQSADPRVRSRARRCLADRERRRVLRRLLAFGMREELDLERGLFLLGRLDLPRLDRRPYVRALDALGTRVRQRVARESDPLARAMVLAQVLGNELGFVGAEVDFSHPDNIHLHRAIERKRGMPLTLTAIYLFVARRAGIRAAPLALPGRVMLKVYAGARSILVDPFHGGRVRTRGDLVRYLGEHGLVARPEWFHDASDAALFQRHVLNLMSSSQARGLRRESRELEHLAAAIGRARNGPHE
jgi:regulator of sirC expression with transglutaminase-like and TPR domain